jgi:hypothetical protein
MALFQAIFIYLGFGCVRMERGSKGLGGQWETSNLLSFLKNYCLELLDLNVQCKLIVSRGFGFSGLN